MWEACDHFMHSQKDRSMRLVGHDDVQRSWTVNGAYKKAQSPPAWIGCRMWGATRTRPRFIGHLSFAEFGEGAMGQLPQAGAPATARLTEATWRPARDARCSRWPTQPFDKSVTRTILPWPPVQAPSGCCCRRASSARPQTCPEPNNPTASIAAKPPRDFLG